MMLMNDDIITLYDSNNQKYEYKLLMVLDKEYKYLIYTNIGNNDIKTDLHAIKIKELNNNEEIIPLTNEEWTMIENEYQNLINT